MLDWEYIIEYSQLESSSGAHTESKMLLLLVNDVDFYCTFSAIFELHLNCNCNRY